ncbi:Mov34/MPN/PAD-1 family protein [Deinococcus metallilatus]|nr:Mov34/MPN/PAD-1 family protein [Deinococcus metallilatus]MBB5293755.1 integrative and conjugative element protein (TIGR02256 family) [Deinococcus metallilatus]GMA17684.1 hypothetical protein GCM10025871_40150 [Deinococcus metallilatus]
MTLLLRTTAGRILEVHRRVLEAMWAYTQVHPKNTEAGGILVGHERQQGNLVLDRFTSPQPGDRRTRTRFHRSVEPHQELLNLMWLASGCTRTYFGEWHTHPEPCPTPSSIDLRSWRKHLKQEEARENGLHFIIVGTAITRVWHANQGGRDVTLIGETHTEFRV